MCLLKRLPTETDSGDINSEFSQSILAENKRVVQFVKSVSGEGFSNMTSNELEEMISTDGCQNPFSFVNDLEKKNGGLVSCIETTLPQRWSLQKLQK